VVRVVATVSSVDVNGLIASVEVDLAEAADPTKAEPMAAYMKTDMPFYGVQKAGRTPILRRLKREFVPTDIVEYHEAVTALWQLPHREEKYLALSYAGAFDEYVDTGSMLMYERIIVEGAWWDFVDEAAARLVGRVLFKEPLRTESTIRSWIGAQDMWLRRTSIICQLKHKDATDSALLADACTANLADTEFFIRKAIGWALREYSKTDPEWVSRYVADNRDSFSGLSYREATKYL
jgi:3-methyladenine DNA glycosylase AlkD